MIALFPFYYRHRSMLQKQLSVPKKTRSKDISAFVHMWNDRMLLAIMLTKV
jgi:hypothetical protein